MTNKISMLAFDLDDTALDGEGKLSDATREAFIAAAEAGVEPVIASGRSFYSLPDYLLEVPGIRYAICSNGANLFDVKNKKCITSMCLKQSSVDQIVAIADDYKDVIYLDAFTEGVPHSDRRLLDTLLNNEKISEHRKKYLRKTRRPEDDIRGFIQANKHNLDCMNYNVFDTSLFDELMGRLANEVDDIYFTSSIPELNIPISEVAAFGNADNDAEMIRVAGVGYAVSNSSQIALDAADHIIGHHAEDAVAKEIWNILRNSDILV